MISNMHIMPRKRKQEAYMSVSSGQTKQGTFQSLTTGLGTGNSDHLTARADKNCRNCQLPHSGLGMGGDLQLAVHKSWGPQVSPFSQGLEEITCPVIPVEWETDMRESSESPDECVLNQLIPAWGYFQ